MHESTAEKIARLAEKAQDWNHVPGGTGTGLTPQDICHAIACIDDRLTQYLLITKYGYDESALSAANDLAISAVLKIYNKQIADKGRIGGKRRVEFIKKLSALATAALAEIIEEPVCKKCHGTGSTKKGDVFLVCSTCGGAKHQPWSNNKRAAAMGLHHSSMTNAWCTRYMKMYSEFQIRIGRGLGIVEGRLR